MNDLNQWGIGRRWWLYIPELSDGEGCRRTPCSWPPGARSPGPAAAGSSSPAPGTPTPILPCLTFIQCCGSGSRMDKKSISGSVMNIRDHISERSGNKFLVKNTLKFYDADPESFWPWVRAQHCFYCKFKRLRRIADTLFYADPDLTYQQNPDPEFEVQNACVLKKHLWFWNFYKSI